uniref:Uncharacterized protein n=1 Tax=Eutreptiella gymnastica TaxID=73025 RepID=A0A7S1JCR6_9EUGL|mmetsp:Transcript_8268/g.14791  ORF Transcript_8268/g.14791 Transcript_8268/m.14791 type:complete len:151 (+) Transcript_8268:63-515(+)
MSSLYSNEETRLKSFRTWPHTTSKTATPAKLAAAGFFHNPTSENLDRCTCFMCGTSLVSWDVTDIPLDEHRKHSKHCEFLLQLTRYNMTQISLCADDPEEEQDSAFIKVTRSIIDEALKRSTPPQPGTESGRRTQLRSGVVKELLFGSAF